MKKLLFLLLFATGAVLSNANAVSDSIGMKTIEGKPHILYLVNAGETIYAISTKYQVTIEQLMNVNPELENGLRTGQILSIPYKPKSIKEEQERNKVVYHTVQPGETMFSLSKKYKIPLNDMMKWNGMELKVGQKVVIGKADGGNVPDVFAGNTSTKKVEQSVKKENKKVADPTKPKPQSDLPASVLGPKTRKRVLIIPFDPYLYFSDADDEIARASRLHRTEVRQMFRKRLDALVDPPGFETIHLLGGIF